MNTDIYTIVIPRFKIFGYHGCYDKEKKDGQEFEVGMEICIESSPIREYDIDLDNLKNTIDYVEIENRIKKVFNDKKFNLLETLASHISNIPYELATKKMSKSIFSVEVVIRKKNPIAMSVPYIELKYIKMSHDKQNQYDDTPSCNA